MKTKSALFYSALLFVTLSGTTLLAQSEAGNGSTGVKLPSWLGGGNSGTSVTQTKETYTETHTIDMDPMTETPFEKRDREARGAVKDPATANMFARQELIKGRTYQEAYMVMHDKYLTCKNEECQKLNFLITPNIEIGFTASADGKSYSCYAYQRTVGTKKYLAHEEGVIDEEPRQ